jgi:hypothetical protein
VDRSFPGVDAPRRGEITPGALGCRLKEGDELTRMGHPGCSVKVNSTSNHHGLDSTLCNALSMTIDRCALREVYGNFCPLNRQIRKIMEILTCSWRGGWLAGPWGAMRDSHSTET